MQMLFKPAFNMSLYAEKEKMGGGGGALRLTCTKS